MNTAFKNFGIIAMTMIMAVISGCEKVDDIPVSNGNVDNNKTEVTQKPDVVLQEGEQNEGVYGALYEGKYNRPYSINIFVKSAQPEDIHLEPQGFSVDISELRRINNFTLPGYACYEAVLTGATGMEPGKEYSIKVHVSNQIGTTIVDYPISVIYLNNIFKNGAYKTNNFEYATDDCFTGEMVRSQETHVYIPSNIGFDVEILEDKTVAQIKKTEYSMFDRFHPILHHYDHKNPSFYLVTKRNTTSEGIPCRIRITDVNKVISYEGVVEIPRKPGLTVEEEMAKELAAMKIIRDALGLKDDPDYSDNVPLNQWPGVWAPDYPDGGYFVREIEWRGPLICGQIPEAVKDLDHCTRFRLYAGNRVTGKIPDGFADMEKLMTLEISDPEEGYGLEGRLDECSLGKIVKQLKFLSLWKNNLTGPIPEWLGDMPNYSTFIIRDNRLEGKVPEKVQNHPYFDGKDDANLIQQPGYILYL